jgi:predicted dienelactone hydrolase
MAAAHKALLSQHETAMNAQMAKLKSFDEVVKKYTAKIGELAEMKKALEQMKKDVEEMKAAHEKMMQEHAQIDADHKKFDEMAAAAAQTQTQAAAKCKK